LPRGAAGAHRQHRFMQLLFVGVDPPRLDGSFSNEWKHRIDGSRQIDDRSGTRPEAARTPARRACRQRPSLVAATSSASAGTLPWARTRATAAARFNWRRLSRSSRQRPAISPRVIHWRRCRRPLCALARERPSAPTAPAPGQ
jgi:hypothetical protein